MNGSTSETTTPLPRITWCAWMASSLARWASRSASSANWVGFMRGPPGSGGLRGKELRMHDGATARQHDTFHDVIAVGQLWRLCLLVPERREEGQQVAGIQRR